MKVSLDTGQADNNTEQDSGRYEAELVEVVLEELEVLGVLEVLEVLVVVVVV